MEVNNEKYSICFLSIRIIFVINTSTWEDDNPEATQEVLLFPRTILQFPLSVHFFKHFTLLRSKTDLSLQAKLIRSSSINLLSSIQSMRLSTVGGQTVPVPMRSMPE